MSIHDLSSLVGIQGGYADLLRSDYNDYQTRFRPFETLLSNYFNGPDRAYEQAALGYARQGVTGAYQAARAYQNELARRTGTRLEAAERNSVGRQLGNERAALLAQAVNGARDSVDQRNLGLLGQAVNLGQQDRQAALQGLGYLAQVDATRSANNKAMNQAASAQQQQTLFGAAGSLLGGALGLNPVTGAVMGGLSLLGSLF